DRRLRTVAENADELAITRLDRLPDAVRGALAGTGVRVVEIPADDAGQPARALPAARLEVQKARAALERRLAERRLARLGSDEWLVVDGVLSDSPALSAHPRAVGVVKSHGAEYFEGPELERALTLPALHRTSVFRPQRRGARPARPRLASRTPHPATDRESFRASRFSSPEDRIVIDRRDPPPIGRVVATEQKPATPHQFHFWTANETSIGIGAIVRVEGAGSGEQGAGKVVYGVVTDGFAYSDLATPLHDVVGAEGDPARAAEHPTVRQEIRLWTAAVLRQRPEEPLQPR